MADEPLKPVEGAAPIVAEPAVVVAEAPAVVAEVPAVVAEAPPPEKPATVAETPSLLEEAKPPGDGKAEEKPVETEVKAEAEKPEVKAEGDKPKEEAKAEEDKPKVDAEKPALEVIDYKYEIPEGVLKLDDKMKGELHTVFDGFRADPSNPQGLIDFHVARVNEAIAQVERNQQQQFLDYRKTNREKIAGDEEMGGSGIETTKTRVATMRDLLVSSHKIGTPEYEKHLQEANEFFRTTGAGDHPVLWRILHNAARYVSEANLPPNEIRPAPGGKQPGSRRGLLYNHPTSPNNRDG